MNTQIKFEDNYKFQKYEKVFHRAVGNCRYWIIVGLDPDTETHIFRIEVHAGDCCELFTHTRMVEHLYTVKELRNSAYNDTIKDAIRFNPELKYKWMLDSELDVEEFYKKRKYLSFWKRLFK